SGPSAGKETRCGGSSRQPRRRSIYGGPNDKSARFWTLLTATELKQLRAQMGDRVAALALAADVAQGATDDMYLPGRPRNVVGCKPAPYHWFSVMLLLNRAANARERLPHLIHRRPGRRA